MKAFIRYFIRGKYAIRCKVAGQLHQYPNRDQMQHEAVDCPCGPVMEWARDDNDDPVRIMKHWSLDAREAIE